MVLKYSTQSLLGAQLPDFKCFDVVQQDLYVSSEASLASAYVVMIWCNHCPYVKHIAPSVVAMAQKYKAEYPDLSWVAVSANDALQYPEDGPGPMQMWAQTQGWPYPYLYDQDQRLVKALGAVCTPEFYIANAQRQVTYIGCYDAATPGNQTPVTGQDFEHALLETLAGKSLTVPPKPSCGCSIKWHDREFK